MPKKKARKLRKEQKSEEISRAMERMEAIREQHLRHGCACGCSGPPPSWTLDPTDPLNQLEYGYAGEGFIRVAGGFEGGALRNTTDGEPILPRMSADEARELGFDVRFGIEI